MSTPRTRGRKALLIVLSVVSVGLAGGLGYMMFAKNKKGAETLEEAEKDYAAGVEAYTKGDGKSAADHFERTRLRSEKILQGIEKSDDPNVPKTPQPELHGKLHYLRARAIRDSFFARALRDEKPIPETDDTTTNEKYRNFWSITDPNEIDQAVGSLRIAGEKLTKDPEVLKDNLRVELTFPGGMQWDRISTLCQQIIDLNPRDGRALYWLARHEFLQPTIQTGWRETEWSKRGAVRVEKALQFARRAGQTNTSPYWRTTYLEAQILEWLARDAAIKKKNSEYNAELRKLLLDPATGVVAKASKADAINVPHQFDLEGVLGLQRMAVQMLAQEARTTKAREDELAELLTGMVDLVAKVRETAVGKGSAAFVTVSLLQAANAGQLVLARTPHPSWAKIFDAAWANAEQTEATNLDRPEVIILLADLNANEVYFNRKRNNTDQAGRIEKRMFSFLKDALDDAEKQKRPAALKDMLQRAALETKYRSGLRGDDIMPHIEALKLSARPENQARAVFFEGLLAQRQGRLVKARENLEKVIANKDLRDLHFPARLELIQILLALGQPEAALIQLRDIEPALERPDELAPAELAWRDEVIQTTDNFRALMVVAQLDTSIGRIVRYLRDNPGQAVPDDIGAIYEKGAESYLIRLKAGTPADRMARLATYNYWTRLGKRERAGATLKELEARFPNDLQVLESRVRFSLMPPEKAVAVAGPGNTEARDKADNQIREYIAKHPGERDPKLFWARWLLQTNRTDEAVAYLEDKKNFEDQKDAAVARTLAQALIRGGKPEAASKLLDAFPSDPSIDIALIQAAGNRADQEKQLKDALKRYENNALIRLYEASTKLNEGKYEEAIEGFLHATDFQQIKNAAQAGLLRALLAYATEKPGVARDLVVRLLKEFPKEPILALGAAVAAFNLDDIGNPNADWSTSRSMGAALAKWEQLADPAASRPALALVKAQFWYSAGKPDFARQEALRGMGREGTHLPSVNFVLGLALESRNAALVKQVKDWLADNRKKNPKAIVLTLLDGRIREFEGPADAVVDFYKTEIAAQPKETSLYDRFVSYLLREGQNIGALDWAKKWREALPESDPARLAIVQALAVQGDLGEAKKAADDFIKYRSDARKKQLSEVKPPPANSAAAKDWPKRQQEMQEEADRTAQLEVAAMFFRAKQYATSEAYAQATLRTKDDYVPGQLLLGDIGLANKKYPEAAKFYQAILDKNPRHLVAANNLAYTLSENLNKPEEAMKVVEKYRKDATGDKPLSTDRLPAAMLDTLGVVYLKLKQPAKFQEMKQIFESAVERYPRDPRMHYYLGLSCIELGFKNQAVPYLKAADKIVSAPGYKDLPDSEAETLRVSVKDALKRVGN